MNRIHKWTVFLLVFLLTVNGVFYVAFADHDGFKEKNRHQKRERKHAEHNGKGNSTMLNNPTYTENCGTCHFAYPPGLLPSGSWVKILADPADHFGETIELDPESKKTIAEYLKANAADFSSAKLSAKIMKSIRTQTPQRITDIPLFQKTHHEIKQDVIKRKSIGSLANCSACHTTAEKGIFIDDNIKIPK